MSNAALRDTTSSGSGNAAGGAAPGVKSLATFQFRTILGHYPTGVVVVTALDAAGSPIGMTAGSFPSVSLDPPLIGFLSTRDSGSFRRLRALPHSASTCWPPARCRGATSRWSSSQDGGTQ